MTKNGLTYHALSSWRNMTVSLWTVVATSFFQRDGIGPIKVGPTQRYTKQAKFLIVQSTATSVDRHCAATAWSACDIIYVYTYGDIIRWRLASRTVADFQDYIVSKIAV